MSQKNKIQEIIDAQKQQSPVNGLSNQQIAVKIANSIYKNNNPDWVKKTAERNRQQAQDPNWLEKTAERNRQKAHDPNWIKANQQGADKRKERIDWLRENDPEEYKKYIGYREHSSEETKQKQKQKALDRWSDPEQRRKQSETMKGRKMPRFKCEYCGKEMGKANLTKHGHTVGRCVGKDNK